MTNRYVDVVISRQTAAVSQKGFGLPIVLSGEKAAAYKEYTEIAGIGTDFGTSSDTYKLASAMFAQTPRPDTIAIYGIVATGAAGELATALNDLILEHNDFYYLTSTEHTAAAIQELAGWTNTQDKLYFSSSSDETLAALNSERTFVMIHPDADTAFPGEAVVGRIAPLEIGSYTVTFKTLNGINPAGYDVTTINAIENKNMSTYIKEGGVNIISKGVTTSGEYVDVIQGQDYLKARMTENVFGLLVRSDKVPFTDAGIAMIVAEVTKTLVDGVNRGIIATDADGNPLFTVTAPTASEVSANDKANRTLPDVNWTATIAGAVENVDINGVLKL